jgi:hypothetical protein
MKSTQANLLNGIILLAVGLYGYFAVLKPDGTHAITALIPAVFGIILLACQKGVATEHKIIAHVAVMLTLILLIVCVKQFFTIEDWGAKKYLFLACIVSNVIALIAFIGSFIEARKKRQ